jgi:hypothetical protein
MATDGKQLFVGGDFTTVNSKPQQGFAIFSSGAERTVPPTPAKPTVTSTAAGQATVTLDAVSTPQFGKLTYRIFRTGRKALLATVSATSWPWAEPVIHYQATGLKPGSRVSFTVSVTDGYKTSGRSAESSVITVARKNPAASYEKTVLRSRPTFYWLLDQRSGDVADDASGHHFRGTYEAGTRKGVAGPIAASKATATGFNGSTGIVTLNKRIESPATFTIEAWFKTSTITGGELVGFGGQKTGVSLEYDRQIYMMNDGQLVFGVQSGSQHYTIQTSNVYNDDRWHYVVATFKASGKSGTLTLYVDGHRINSKKRDALSSYKGHWRVGGGNLTGWNLDPWGSNSQGTTQPNSYYFDGTIGDVAVYPTALSSTSVAEHYAASGK